MAKYLAVNQYLFVFSKSIKQIQPFDLVIRPKMLISNFFENGS